MRSAIRPNDYQDVIRNTYSYATRSVNTTVNATIAGDCRGQSFTKQIWSKAIGEPADSPASTSVADN